MPTGCWTHWTTYNKIGDGQQKKKVIKIELSGIGRGRGYLGVPGQQGSIVRLSQKMEINK